MRDLVSSRQSALETAQLLYRFVGMAKFNNIESLIDQIKAVGRKLVAANPKEPAVGNIIRKVLRLIREEYKSAYTAHLLQNGIDERGQHLSMADPTASSSSIWLRGKEGDSIPGTPMPPTPGIHPPPSHYLSQDYNRLSSGPQLGRNQTSLSNYVKMRHTRAQLERAGSSLPPTGSGLGGGNALMGALAQGLANMALTPASLASSLTSDSIPASTSIETVTDANQKQGRRTSFPGLRAPQDDATEFDNQSPSLPWTAKEQAVATEFGKKATAMKPVLLDAIREVLDEIETTHEACAKGAKEHIHSSEIILTTGCSRTVEAFLKAAKKDRDFTVIVAETTPSNEGHEMARNLAKLDIQTILVPDSAVFALMPRVTKVLLGAHSVLANGGVFTVSGSSSAAIAAKYHATPVVIVSGQYKFAPARNTYHEHSALEFGDPAEVLNASDGLGTVLEKVEVTNPFYDYIKPDLINLFITNE